MGRRSRPPATDEVDASAAVEIALRYLGSRPRSRWELDRRLRRAGASDTVIEAALRRLGELGYVDDVAFARWWGEQRDRHAPRGLRMIAAELRQRGVPRDVIEQYRFEHEAPERPPHDAGLPSSEADRCREALDRHLRGRAMPAEPGAIRRLGMHLMRRGFDPGTVRSILREASGTELDAD
jgi:regulatory protein